MRQCSEHIPDDKEASHANHTATHQRHHPHGAGNVWRSQFGAGLLRFNTYNGYSILRAIPTTTADADVAKALDLVQKTRVYALAQAANSPPQRYIDMAGKLFDGIARFDDSFYDSLARMVNDEPVQTRDLVAMGQLRSIGIEKGKEFKPDAATRDILKQAIAEAQAGFMQFMTALPSFAPGSQWTFPGTPVGPETAEDHYTQDVLYGGGSHTFTRQQIGTRYVALGIRILVNPADPADIKAVHALQDAVTVAQPGGPGRFDVPHWDQASQKLELSGAPLSSACRDSERHMDLPRSAACALTAPRTMATTNNRTRRTARSPTSPSS